MDFFGRPAAGRTARGWFSSCSSGAAAGAAQPSPPTDGAAAAAIGESDVQRLLEEWGSGFSERTMDALQTSLTSAVQTSFKTCMEQLKTIVGGIASKQAADEKELDAKMSASDKRVNGPEQDNEQLWNSGK